MPFKSILLWQLQKYKKWVIPDFDIPETLAVMPTPFRPLTARMEWDRDWEQSGAWRVIIYTKSDPAFCEMAKEKGVSR